MSSDEYDPTPSDIDSTAHGEKTYFVYLIYISNPAVIVV